MGLKSRLDVTWHKIENIILIYWISKREKNLFSTVENDFGRISQFFFHRKVFHFPPMSKNNSRMRIRLLHGNIRTKWKQKKMCGKFLSCFSFFFLEQQSIFLILSFVVLLSRWSVEQKTEKSLACFSFQVSSTEN